MFQFHIEDMVEELIKDGVCSEDQRDQATKSIQKHWNETIAINWNVEDVLSCAKENYIDITNEQALEVLQSVFENHDASVGVNWDVILCRLENY